MNMSSTTFIQEETCRRAGSPVCIPNENLKIGIALQTKKLQPVTGMRGVPENGTEGWYVWAGEYSKDPDFFQPIHIIHLIEIWPEIVPYLALAPGYRFIIDNEGYEDMWYEPIIGE
mgnify:CR=1 FL=1